MFGIDDVLLGGLIGGGLSFLGGERRNDAQAQQAEQANAFSAQQFASRYQTTVKDMEAAGLNPMLAYSQGGGTPPSGQQGQMTDSISPAVQSFNQSKLASAQVANVQADTENKKAQADLIAAQAAHSWASAGQANAQTGLINETVDKVKQEVLNLKTDNERVRAVIDNLRIEYENLIKKGYNLTEVGNQLRASISQMQAQIPLINQQAFKTEMEGYLAQFDVKAATDFGNLGRSTQQVKPLLDILRMLTRK